MNLLASRQWFLDGGFPSTLSPETLAYLPRITFGARLDLVILTSTCDGLCVVRHCEADSELGLEEPDYRHTRYMKNRLL